MIGLSPVVRVTLVYSVYNFRNIWEEIERTLRFVETKTGEISSFGGLPEGFSREDFLNGYSLPVNPELIRVFRDLGLAERLGTGIRRVLKFYPKEIFRFSANFLRVNVPFERPIPSYSQTGNKPKPSLYELLKE